MNLTQNINTLRGIYVDNNIAKQDVRNDRTAPQSKAKCEEPPLQPS